MMFYNEWIISGFPCVGGNCMLTDPTWPTPPTQSHLLFTDLPSHHSIDNDLSHHITFQHLHPVAVIRALVGYLCFVNANHICQYNCCN